MRPIPDAIAQAARAAQARTGIPASSQIAQWAVESAWGVKCPGNNPFGIKARPGEAHVTFATHEVVHGQRVEVMAAFRAFASIAEAFEAHAALLAQAECYAPARAKLPDVGGFCDALTGVYATDPKYGATLRSVIASNALARFDVQGPGNFKNLFLQPPADAGSAPVPPAVLAGWAAGVDAQR